MPDLDARLSRALDAVADADPSVRARALRAAVGALPATPSGRSGSRRATAALTVAAALVGGGAVAAVGGLTDEQSQLEPLVVPGRLTMPDDSNGIGVLAGGRAWVALRNGLRIEGIPATALEISPLARFAAVGMGRSLVVVGPDGQSAWSLPTLGPVRQVAWRPDGLEIAYVVGRGRTRSLRVVEADGDHDRLLATIAPVRPYWSADSLGIGALTPGRRRVMFEAASGRPLARPHSAAGVGPSLLAEIRGSDLVIVAPTRSGRARVATLTGLGGSAPITLIRR